MGEEEKREEVERQTYTYWSLSAPFVVSMGATRGAETLFRGDSTAEVGMMAYLSGCPRTTD